MFIFSSNLCSDVSLNVCFEVQKTIIKFARFLFFVFYIMAAKHTFLQNERESERQLFPSCFSSKTILLVRVFVFDKFIMGTSHTSSPP